MSRIRYFLFTAGLLVFASWAIRSYRGGVLHAEFLQYGQSRPGSASEIINAARLNKLDSTAATVRGKATNSITGSPLKDALVIISPVGQGRVAGAAMSDAAGNYEIRVSPGLYSVEAEKDGFVPVRDNDVAYLSGLQLGVAQKAAIDFRLVPAATITGTVTDASGTPIPDASLRAMIKVYRQGKIELQQAAGVPANDRGEYVLKNLPAGRYYVQAGKMGVAGPGRRTFLPMMYPATSRIDEAQAIRVNAGQVKNAVNFRLRDAAKHNVSGRLTFLANGLPVANMAISMGPDFPGFGANAKTQSRADGTFRLEGLTAGRYRMEGRLVDRDGEGSGRGYFLRFLEVKAADIANMNIRVGHGTTLKGKLQAAGGTLQEKMTVQVVVRNPFEGTGFGQSVVAAADGTFGFGGLQPGIWDLDIVKGLGRNEFFVGAVIVDGQDVSESGIRVLEDTASINVSLTVDFRPGTIKGKTLDSEGKPIPGANLALMSVDPKKRVQKPYWRQINSDLEGAFRLGSLIPGDYFLIVWPRYRPWSGLNPEAFALLEKHAVRVSVEPSGVINQDLRLTREMRDLLDALYR